MGKSQELYKKAKKLIPGGSQLLSKRPEMFLPELWPAYYKKAKGCEIWDLDDKKYVDMSYMGLGACILGYADNDVNKAVKKIVRSGNMSTLNCPDEVELAEVLCGIHPWAGMVRYARTGGEAMSIATRIARAKSGKDIVLFCGYHGWHDWYISANLFDGSSLDSHLLPGLNPLGVPKSLKGSAYPFYYNDAEGFLKLANKYKGRVGVIVLESIRNNYPTKEFIDAVKKAVKDLNIVLIVDEISAGWRLNAGGAHMILGIEPDIAVFAKGISNGFAMAAIIGKKEVMRVAQDTFISSTYWTEGIGPAAALATIKKIRDLNVPEHLIRMGKLVQKGWKDAAEKYGLSVDVGGIYPLSHFSFKNKNNLELKTLFTQSMLEKGFLATTAFYPSYTHKKHHIDRYLEAADRTFDFISGVVGKNSVKRYLKGPVCHSGFKRLT